MSKHEQDILAGRCPFCGFQGLISDPSDWCEHHVGTYDLMMGSEPVDCLASDGEFDAFRELLSSYQDLDEEEQEELCKQLPEDLSLFLQRAAENSVEMFWLGLVPSKELEADVSESLFDTTYVSVFVEDADAARKLLSEKVRSIMQKVSID
jgi:hypothetical protein